MSPVYRGEQREIVFPERPARPLPRDAILCQLKITMLEIDPPIWRRVQVPADYSLRELHDVLITVFGRLDYHLHQFEIRGVSYGEPDPDYPTEPPMRRDDRTKLRSVLTRLGATMRYEYDFGDCWEHEIILEGMFLAEEAVIYPRCIAGARAAPPEDCGGVPGYKELLEILEDPDHEEYEHMVQWTGGGFDPEACDLDDINWALQLTEDDSLDHDARRAASPISLRPPTEPDEVQLAPAQRFARYIHAIAAAGSLAPVGTNVQTAIRCRRRPSHRRCPGYLTVRRSDVPAEIDYQCLVCGRERGTVHGWKDSIADLSVEQASVSNAKRYEFFLRREEYETFRSLLPFDPESERVIYGAHLSEDGIRLTATIQELAGLQGLIQLAGQFETQQSKRRKLVRLLVILAGVVPLQDR